MLTIPAMSSRAVVRTSPVTLTVPLTFTSLPASSVASVLSLTRFITPGPLSVHSASGSSRFTVSTPVPTLLLTSSVFVPPPPLTLPKLRISLGVDRQRRVDVDGVADRVGAVEIDRAARHVERASPR